jgi:putative membrane protein
MQRFSAIRKLVFAAFCLLAMAQMAFAHGGHSPSFAEVMKQWAFDPLVVIGLALSGWLYFFGLWRIWRESATGKGIRIWEAAAYGCGWLALALALISPLHSLGEVLFSAHMVQHEVLMIIAAPLLVLGRPLVPFLWALPMRWRRSAGNLSKENWVKSSWRFVTAPLVAWLIHGVALWVWHLPALFQATLESDVIHSLQHISFLGSALLFWWALIYGRQGALGYGAGVLYVFSTAMHSGLLGALLTFASKTWYPAYSKLTPVWGLSPIEDQQLGGLIMWVPAGIVYAGAGLLLFVAWLKASEKRLAIREQQI